MDLLCLKMTCSQSRLSDLKQLAYLRPILLGAFGTCTHEDKPIEEKGYRRLPGPFCRMPMYLQRRIGVCPNSSMAVAAVDGASCMQ
jgi:hypothetical protein